MLEPIHVIPGELLASGALVEGHVADLEAGHAMADARIQGAQPGLVGLSALAVEAKLAQWQATTQALTTRLADHAQAFQTTGVGFESTNTRNAQSLAAVGAEAQPTRL